MVHIQFSCCSTEFALLGFQPVNQIGFPKAETNIGEIIILRFIVRIQSLEPLVVENYLLAPVFTVVVTISRSCVFAVDVYREVYDYASNSFTDVLDIDSRLLRTADKQGDFIEDRIHPDDRDKLIDLQLWHGKFIYSLPREERNDYRTIYQVRMRNANNKYINITSRNQVIETDSCGKAWIIMGMMEVSVDQTPTDRLKCSVLNLKTGRFFNPYAESTDRMLTGRELEILSFIGQGYLSKEVADKLGVSIFTINNHRKNILAKLESDNAIEAINTARSAGLID